MRVLFCGGMGLSQVAPVWLFRCRERASSFIPGRVFGVAAVVRVRGNG